MGYSIYVNIPDKKKRDQIYNFLQKEYKNFNQLMKDEPNEELASIFDDDLSYKNKDDKDVIGFNYSSWINPHERHYINSICSWIALQLGGENPYYIYDGHEKMYMENRDHNGYKPMIWKSLSPGKKYFDKFNLLLDLELQRLSQTFMIKEK